MSYMNFRVLWQSPLDTVEVWGSSPHGPTISFNNIETLPAFCVAPDCSNKSISRLPLTKLQPSLSASKLLLCLRARFLGQASLAVVARAMGDSFDWSPASTPRRQAVHPARFTGGSLHCPPSGDAGMVVTTPLFA